VRFTVFPSPHQELTDVKKHLTKEHYKRLLAVIGQSERPLSSYEIRQKSKSGGGGQDVYRKIKDLTPPPREEKREMLFEWNSIILQGKDEDDIRTDTRLIKCVRNILGLDWLLNDRSSSSDELVHIEKRDAGQTINIIFNDQRAAPIRLRLADDRTSIDILSSDGKPLRTLHVRQKKVNEKVRLYVYDKTVLFNQKRVQYLDISLSDSAQNRIRQIEDKKLSSADSDEEKSVVQLSKIIDEIKNDTRNYRYSLNLRGLLLYLASVIELEERRMARKKALLGMEKIISDKAKLDTAEIYSIIKNLAKSGKEEFSNLFLGYHDLDAVIERMSNGISPNYTATILKKIAGELYPFLQSADVQELKLLTVRRFLDAIDLFLKPSLLDGTIRQYADERAIKNLVQYKSRLEEYLARLLQAFAR
jgi:hypothetical protein